MNEHYGYPTKSDQSHDNGRSPDQRFLLEWYHDRKQNKLVIVYRNPVKSVDEIWEIDSHQPRLVFISEVIPSANNSVATGASLESNIDNHNDITTSAAPRQLIVTNPKVASIIHLPENEIKKWWYRQSIIMVDGEHPNTGKVIGFQLTDSGYLGAIVVNNMTNKRELYGLDFRSGRPRPLGAPKPPKR